MVVHITRDPWSHTLIVSAYSRVVIFWWYPGRSETLNHEPLYWDRRLRLLSIMIVRIIKQGIFPSHNMMTATFKFHTSLSFSNSRCVYRMFFIAWQSECSVKCYKINQTLDLTHLWIKGEENGTLFLISIKLSPQPWPAHILTDSPLWNLSLFPSLWYAPVVRSQRVGGLTWWRWAWSQRRRRCSSCWQRGRRTCRWWRRRWRSSYSAYPSALYRQTATYESAIKHDSLLSWDLCIRVLCIPTKQT